ncbi:MAG: enoyl-CoA hydratase/isomerase family protein [Alphaproteobacteria bacterium]|nr:enoyl-CoA hydratase/isomerase family protein [Alphaproteobacteria bacterium]
MATPQTSISFADGNILASRRVPVTTIVINRAEEKNALDAKTARGLADVLQLTDNDDEIRAIVLASTGGAFCSGADLKELTGGADYLPWAGDEGPLRVAPRKPVIAAIEGPACAEGLGLALFCDIRLIDDSAVFGVLSRLSGMPIGDGTTARLPRLIGLSRALDMIVTGRTVGADEAVATGLATRKVMLGTTRVEAEKLAHKLAELPQGPLLADLRSVYEGLDLSCGDAIRREVDVARATFGPETRASIARHLQRVTGSIRLLRA